MTVTGEPAWLVPAHGAALVVHALIVAFFCLAAIASGVMVATGANSMRSDMVAFALIAAVNLLPATPSGIALASWAILRRRGQSPSTQHRALAIAGAFALIGVIIYAGFAG